MSPSSRFVARTVILSLVAALPAAQPMAATTGVLTIEWDANSTDADLGGYRVFLSRDVTVFDLTPAQARSRATTQTAPPGTLERVFQGLETNDTYYIAVTCFDNSGNESVFSPVVQARPCDAATSGSLTVSWDGGADEASAAAGYRVYVSPDASVFELSPAEARSRSATRTVAPGTTEAHFTELDATRTYFVGVTSYDASGTESGFSEVMAAVPALIPTLCTVNPYAAQQGSSGVEVTLRGTNFQPGASADFGPDVQVSSIDTTGAPTRLVARLNVAPLAQVDSRDVRVTNPDGAVSVITGAFDVLVDPTRVDLNGSSRIDGGDMVQVAAAFSARDGDSRYTVALDLNVDGVVDGTDLSLLVLYFGLIAPF